MSTVERELVAIRQLLERLVELEECRAPKKVEPRPPSPKREIDPHEYVARKLARLGYRGE